MIIGTGGPLSGGKTVTNMFLIKQSLDEGKKIISVVKLNDIKHRYLTSTELANFLLKYLEKPEVLEKTFYNTFLFIDEIRNLISARKSSSNLNEMFTQFFMMLGKLDCDLGYTYQVFDSMIDKQLKEITDLNLKCTRRYLDGTLIRGGKRILKDENGNLIPIKIRIEAQKWYKEKLINLGRSMEFDPSPYYKMYNTRELILVDRTKYLVK